jgi:hypothetical protein
MSIYPCSADQSTQNRIRVLCYSESIYFSQRFHFQTKCCLSDCLAIKTKLLQSIVFVFTCLSDHESKANVTFLSHFKIKYVFTVLTPKNPHPLYSVF